MRGLYAITDAKLTKYDGILEFAMAALRGGARILQLRDKDLNDIELYPIAMQLRHVCHLYGAKFIVNDRLDLAIKVRADGVHLGRDDADVKLARKIYDKIIGVSCYGDVEYALKMQRAGASYVAFGSFFASPTKPHAQRVSLDVINAAKARLSIPLAVIGGIKAQNTQDLIARGADMVCVISDLWSARNVEEKAREFSSCFWG